MSATTTSTSEADPILKLHTRTGFPGNLTPQQEKAFSELKQRLQASEFSEDVEKDLDGDNFILSFLRATMKDKTGERVFQVPDAEKRIKSTLKWRREMNADQIRKDIEEGVSPDVYKLYLKLYPNYDCISEENGIFLRFNRFGRYITCIDHTALTTEQWTYCLAYDSFKIQHELRKLSKQKGRLVSTYVTCVDASGLSLIALSGKLSFLQLMSGTAAEHFPEMLCQTIIMNAGWMFSKCFAVVKPFLDKDTVSKFVIKSDTPTELIERFIPRSLILKEYGGDNEAVLPLPLHDKEYVEPKN